VQVNEETGAQAPAEYEGTVTTRSLGFLDRLEVQQTAGADGIALLRASALKAKELFVTADITRLKDGEKFTTWEDLDGDADVGQAVIIELAQRVHSPRKAVGNGSASSSSAPSSAP
jgi:hypothetical protein